MSTCSSTRRLLSPIEDPERLLSRRNQSEPSLLFNLEEDDMAGQAPSQGPIHDLRSMKELLQASTDGVGDAIVVPPLLFMVLLNLVTAIAFHGNGNFLTKNTQEALTIIENKSKVQTFRNKPQVASASGSSTQDAHVIALTKQCQAVSGYNQEEVYATTGSAFEQHHLNPREDLKAITTRSGVTLAGPSVPPPPSSFKEVEQESKTTTNQVLTEITTRVSPSVVQPSPASTSFEIPPAPDSSLVIPEPNPHQPLIPYPSRLNKKKLQDKADIQIHSFLQMFKKIYFNISFVEALAHMPKFAKMVKDLLSNKEKLLELENTPLNKNCSVVLLKNYLKNLKTLGVDYDVDPPVPRILGRPFLRTAHALVDVHGEELTVRVGDENLVFNVESTSKYPRKRGDESIYKIDILDITCEDHFHKVLNVQKSINPMSGSPTPSSGPVVESLFHSLTPFG
ncbi:hypothetical protein Tco_1426747, partial [Tanacetum coccineum]